MLCESLTLCLDVEKTLSQMERVIGFHNIADEVEARIREGPSGNIDGYLTLLDQLKGALDFFAQNNPESVEMGHVSELFDIGLETLSREFLQLLKKHSKPVPIATLHDVAATEDNEGRTDTASVYVLDVHLPLVSFRYSSN